MATWLDSDVFIILRTYFTQLEGASCECKCKTKPKLVVDCDNSWRMLILTHFAIKLILLLSHRNVVLILTLYSERQIRIVRTPIWIQVESLSVVGEKK
jgi:hypothetical protein